ncbi:MAG: type II secretion system F family protein [Elusimicrobiota bacterium]
MARFSYTVQDSQSRTLSGTLEAVDENEAMGSLQGKGYFVLSLIAEQTQAKSGAMTKAISGSGVTARDLVFFSEQLATLLNGGIPLVRALSLLGEHASSKGLHEALLSVTKDVSGGMALYKSFEKHPRIFDTLWISLVQAGEMGGQLPKALKQIGTYIEAQEELKSKILTALAYPAVLAFMSMSVLAFFVIKIVPVFATIFDQFHMTLPPLTKAVIVFSDLVVHHLFLLIAVSIFSYLMWKAYTATEVGQQGKWKLIFSVPFFGAFIKNILIERLLTTLSTLIESGVSILNAISVLELVFSKNVVFRRLLKSAREDVAGGKSISAAFRREGILPPLITEMMYMGEESGKLPDMLVTLSAFYREQIDQFTRRFTAIIDPILVVGIGGLVGTIVLAVFLPIFKLSTLGGAH